jgi:hypothetical protein
MTRIAVGLAVFCPLVTGCVSPDGASPLRRAWDRISGKPSAPDYSPGHIANAARVEELGRQIIAQNTFTGIEPMFQTQGIRETVLFHRGTEELIISDGLVEQCKSEAQLAAVLCSELGQMVAEKRNARRAGIERDTIPEVGLPGGTSTAGGSADDPARAAELAFRERQRPKVSVTKSEPADGKKLARELMIGAGYDPEELDRVQPLLKQSSRGEALKRQMTGPAAAPTWDR